MLRKWCANLTSSVGLALVALSSVMIQPGEAYALEAGCGQGAAYCNYGSKATCEAPPTTCWTNCNCSWDSSNSKCNCS